MMIYIAQTAENNLTVGFNDESSVNVQSCVFNNNPNAIVSYDIVNYANNQAPINVANDVWQVG